MIKKHPILWLFLAATLIISGCANVKRKTADDFLSAKEKRIKAIGSIKNNTGLFKFKTKKSNQTESDNINGAQAVNIVVNPFLWQSSLETLSFMPLLQASPNGGVIIYDWHSLTPNIRYKVNIIITSRAFRVDALKVSVFKQQRRSGQWVDVPPGKQTALQIEETILSRAKNLRNRTNSAS